MAFGKSGKRPTGDLLLVIVVLVALAGAAFLLNRVASQADSISGNAQDIAQSTQGIANKTDAIGMLDRTNELAASILQSAQPLDKELGTTVDLARGIDGKVSVINGSAKAINASAEAIHGTAASIQTHATGILDSARGIQGTAGVINGTAGGINTVAAAILDVAGRINVDVKRINLNLDVTIPIAAGIRSDTDNLVTEARIAHKEAACIDREVHIITPAFNGAAFCTAKVR
jgi:prophage DNA circulation protein